MGFAVVIIGKIKMAVFPGVCLQVLAGVVFYIGVSAALHLESFEYLMGMIRPLLKKIARK